MRYVLPIASAIVILLLGIMVAESSYLQEWRSYQGSYGKLLQQAAAKPMDREKLMDRDLQSRSRELGEGFRVRQRQVVVPELGITDRCVTCHLGTDNPAMARARQPFRAHPGDLLTTHPVEKFGCTTCHRGQGSATTWKDARGIGVFWDEPLLLPAELAQSSCGVCHDHRGLADKGAPLLARGAELFEEHGCRSCHKLRGLGGTLGPALDNVGTKIPVEFSFAHVSGDHTPATWLAQHFQDPQGVSPGSTMPPQTFDEEDMNAMVTYMLAQQAKRIPPRDYLPEDYFISRAAEANLRPYSGEQVYQMLCARCHGSGEKGRFDPAFARNMPAIRSKRFLETASEEFIRAQITSGRPGTLMGAFSPASSGLSEVEFERLIAYVKGGVQDRWGQLKPPLPGSAVRGKKIFAKHCSECHGKAGEGGSGNRLASKAFLRAASDGFIAETVRFGRPGTEMKPFLKSAGGALSEQDIGDLVAFIRSFAGGGKSK